MVVKSTRPSTKDENPVLFEAFEWNLPVDHKHWSRLRQALPALHDIGITDLWLPPGSKGKDAKSNGYDIYDTYDLGEFDQKGTVPTKWGTKDDLVALARSAKTLGMGLVWDAIHNHRAFADETETVAVVEVDPRDRRVEISETYNITAWSKFNYTKRRGKYSTFQYNQSHFNGTDWNQDNKKRSIYRFAGKTWAPDVGKLQGNADYLMLENLDYSNPELVEEVNQWGEWITNELDLKGFRLDAVQHYSWNFANDWSSYLRKKCGSDLLIMGEFWHGDVRVLNDWLRNMNPYFKLYDVPLLYNIARLSWFQSPDLRKVFEKTLVSERPNQAVTFIRCHDTQRGQDMDTPIHRAFTPHAYSLLLLRDTGHPCVFFGDLYGLEAPYPEPPTCFGRLPGLVLARKMYAHGTQTDYFHASDCIGWVRHGNGQMPNGMAVVLSWTQEVQNAKANPCLEMHVGKEHAGEIWTDLLGFELGAVLIEMGGVGRFVCQLNGIACFVNEAAPGRERFPVNFDAVFMSSLAADGVEELGNGLHGLDVFNSHVNGDSDHPKNEEYADRYKNGSDGNTSSYYGKGL
ncbi:alpha amylase [Tothia fuscella]|uniref:Alpha amylase n=1 Tax=Tothia fuscella TaxID=1048955 RepID=A0A9P4NIM1_9PEZI|nr:alpha amylase [Tothia fuscella]